MSNIWLDTIDDFAESGEFHVDFLKNQFSDIARPNMYKILIRPPISDWDDKLTTVLAKNCVIPSVEIGSYDLELCGKTLHLPTNKMTYGDLNISFHCDEAFKLRFLFHKWQKYIYDWDSNIGIDTVNALNGELIINQYNTRLQLVYSYIVTNCWPKTIGEIQLGQDLTNTLEDFTVNFSYTDIGIYSGT